MVAIKDFGMPSCCENCDMCMCLDDDYSGLCYITQTTNMDRTNSRNPNCPLVEIEERKAGKWLSAEEYALKIGAEVTEDIKNSLYKFCPFCEQTVFMERNFCPNCGADMRGNKNE